MSYRPLPSEITSFEIVLNGSELFISSEESSSAAINGYIKLELKEPLHNVRAIDLRFVGGLVASYVDDKHSKSTKTGQRLFDRQLTIFDTSTSERTRSSNVAPTTLSEKQYEFPFQLKVPKGLPPSSLSDIVRTQYLVVAGLHFSYACYGLFPGLAKNSVVTTQEVQVRVSPSITDSFRERLQQQSHLTLNTELEDNNESNSFQEEGQVEPARLNVARDPSWLGLLTWKPCPDIDVHMPPLLERLDCDFMIHIISANELPTLSVSWKLLQHQEFPSLEKIPTKTETVVEGTMTDLEKGDHLGVSICVAHLPISDTLFAQEPPVSTLLEDVTTKAVKIWHTISLGLSWSGNDEKTVDYAIQVPVVVYERASTAIPLEEQSELSALSHQSSETTLIGRDSQIRQRKGADEQS